MVVSIRLYRIKSFGCCADSLAARKGTGRIAGSLIWRPFGTRFKQLIERMEVHKHNISEEVKVWKLKREGQEAVKAAEWRQYALNELEEARKERSLAEEERRLMEEERQFAQDERTRNEAQKSNLSLLMAKVQEAIQNLEQLRLGEW